MIPAREDLLLSVGATFGSESAIYRFKRDGALIDLTGCQAVMRGYALQGGQQLFSWTSQDNKLVMGGVLGTVVPAVSAADTAAIWDVPNLERRSVSPFQGLPTWLAGTWLMDITGPNGLFLRPLQGNLLLIPTSN